MPITPLFFSFVLTFYVFGLIEAFFWLYTIFFIRFDKKIEIIFWVLANLSPWISFRAFPHFFNMHSNNWRIVNVIHIFVKQIYSRSEWNSNWTLFSRQKVPAIEPSHLLLISFIFVHNWLQGLVTTIIISIVQNSRKCQKKRCCMK